MYIPCTPHGSNLVIEHGCNASKVIQYMFRILESLFVYYTGSTKRHDALMIKLGMSDSEGKLKLKNLSKTRWSARPESVRAVWVSFNELHDSLNDIRNNKKCDSYDYIEPCHSNKLI